MRMSIVVVAAALVAGCGSKDFAEAPAGKEQIAVIGGGDMPARYFLVEQEKMPNGRLHAVVLQQFKTGRPGMPIGFQIDCAGGPRWYNAGGATLAAMRGEAVGDERLTMKDRSDESQQIAIWLCDR